MTKPRARVLVSGPECPGCTAPALQRRTGKLYGCPYCGSQWEMEGVECSGCHRLNPPETEMCLNCGDPLTALEGLFQRQLAIGTPLTQTRMQRQVAQLKEKESIASEKRMAEFQEIDRQREQDWAEAEALRRKSEHSTLRWVLGLTAVGVLLILLIILLLATSAS